MKKTTVFGLSVWMGVLVMILALPVFTLGQVAVTIHATDNTTPGLDVTVGFAPTATSGIDASLGEEELPEVAPTFDVRSTTIPSGLGADNLLKGSFINYHHMDRNTQDDRWKISFVSDELGDAVLFTWPAGLAEVGGGGWQLIDGDATTVLADMTTQTSYQYYAKSTSSQDIYIKHFDGYLMRSFPQDSIALARDSKGKTGKVEKRKNYYNEWTFTFQNTTADDMDGMYVEYGQPFTIAPAPVLHDVSGALAKNSADAPGKQKKWTYTGTITAGSTVTIHGISLGSKANVAKKWWWIKGTSNPYGDKKTAPTSASPAVFLVKMPNYNNVIQELYAAGKFPDQIAGKGIGLVIGKTTPISPSLDGKDDFKFVIHPKYGDIYKSLNKKDVTHTGGLKECLNAFPAKPDKPIVKKLSTLPPDKYKNELFGNAVALRLNIKSSQWGYTPTGFGELIYSNGASPFNGWTVSAIDSCLNLFMSCDYAGVGTATDFNTAAGAINAAFVAPFDTVRHAAGFTEVTGVKAVAEVGYLYRAAAVMVPIAGPESMYKEATQVPKAFELGQNYPNPFNPQTTIDFSLPVDARVTLKVYNMLGQEVATLLNSEEMSEGDNSVEFDASALSSGVYFYRISFQELNAQGIQFAGKDQVKKMMLVK